MTGGNHSLWQSRRLWSLWDMIEKYGLLFSRATVMLSEAKWMWAGLDQDVRIGDPQTRFVPLSRLGVEAATKVALDLVREACRLAELDMLPDLARLELLIWPLSPEMPKTGGAMVATAITGFLSRLQDELRKQHFFHLNQEDVRFYGQKDLLGDVNRRSNLTPYRRPILTPLSGEF
jgi:hypothetical protein